MSSIPSHFLPLQTCGTCPVDCGPCQASSLVTNCVEESKYVLNFDGGPTQYTATLLTTLQQYSIPVSFFSIGAQTSATTAMRDSVSRQQSSGYSTLSSTYSHSDMTAMAGSDIVAELRQTEAALGACGVCRKPTLYRPPYGNTNATVIDITSRMGWVCIGMRMMLCQCLLRLPTVAPFLLPSHEQRLPFAVLFTPRCHLRLLS